MSVDLGGGMPAGPGGDRDARYTVRELAALAGVPPSTVTAWMRQELLPPAPVRTRRAFGYRELVRARRLARLRDAGWGPARIGRAVAAARPHVESVDEALAGVEVEAVGRGHGAAPAGGAARRARGDDAVRLGDGRLITAGGQGLFDFGGGAGAGGGVRGLRSPADWFQVGVEREAADDLEAAVAAYERAAPECGAEAWFNLGNCRYRSGDVAGAETAFAAAVQREPDYVEAWNNLGIARGALQRPAAAIAAFRRALELRPHYADAHYNLGDALAAAGDLAGARGHWRAYLTFDPNSKWAEQVRRRLRAAEGDAG